MTRSVPKARLYLFHELCERIHCGLVPQHPISNLSLTSKASTNPSPGQLSSPRTKKLSQQPRR